MRNGFKPRMDRSMNQCKRHNFISIQSDIWIPIMGGYRVYPSCSCGWIDKEYGYGFTQYAKQWWREEHVQPLQAKK